MFKIKMFFVKALMLEIIFKLLFAKSTTTFTNVSKKIFEQHCPYSDLCSQKRISDRPLGDTRIPCCTQCYCDDDCWLYDNCCPDIGGTRPPGKMSIDCKPTNFHYTFKPNAPAPYEVGVLYRIINTCPISYTNEVIRMKCELSETHAVTSFDDIVIVSAAHDHDRIYKNKYCAECHGVVDIKSWQLSALVCSTQIHLEDMTLTSFVDHTLEHCKILSDPYDINLTHKSVCPKRNPLSKCNETRLWEQFDTHIDQACTSYDFLFIDDRKIGNVFYKNVFCFICNQPDDYKFNNVCDAVTFNKRTNVHTMVYLLRNNIDVKRNTAVTDRVCGGNEIYDPFFRICRKFRCQIFYIPINGKCEPYLELTEDMRFTMTLELVPTNAFIINGVIKLYDDVASDNTLLSILKQLGLTPCILCYSHISLYRNTFTNQVKAIIIYMEIRPSNYQCKVEQLLTKMENIALGGKQIFIPVGDIQIQTHVIINYSIIDVFSEAFYKKPEYHEDELVDKLNLIRNCQPYDSMPLYEMFFCPHFALSRNEIDLLTTNISTEIKKNNLSVPSEFFTLKNKHFGVCTDVYLKYVFAKANKFTSFVGCYISMTVGTIIMFDHL